MKKMNLLFLIVACVGHDSYAAQAKPKSSAKPATVFAQVSELWLNAHGAAKLSAIFKQNDAAAKSQNSALAPMSAEERAILITLHRDTGRKIAQADQQ